MADTISAPESGETPESAPAAPPVLDGDEGREGEGFSPSTWEIAAGVILLVAAIVIIVVLTGGDDDSNDALTGPSVPGAAGASVPAGAGPVPGGGVPVTALPEGTPPAPLPTTELATDSFDRANADSLGEADTGQRWISELGTWGIEGNAAVVLQAREEGFRQVALLDPETVYMNQGAVTVEFPDVVPGTGIVFRYSNSFNYYALVALAGDNEWQVQKMVAGEVTPIARVPAPSTGAVTMTVQLRGLTIDVYQGNRAVASVKSLDSPLAGTVGLFATSEAIEEGTWDSFVVGESEVQLDALPPAEGAEGAPASP